MTQQNHKHTSSDNKRHWQVHVKALAESGLSRAEYCRRQKLSYHAMIYWQRKLSRNNSSTNSLVPICIDMGKEQAHGAQLQVNLPGGLSIEVRNNFSSRTLTRLLATLRTR